MSSAASSGTDAKPIVNSAPSDEPPPPPLPVVDLPPEDSVSAEIL